MRPATKEMTVDVVVSSGCTDVWGTYGPRRGRISL
jgi:hypothetical protein